MLGCVVAVVIIYWYTFGGYVLIGDVYIYGPTC